MTPPPATVYLAGGPRPPPRLDEDGDPLDPALLGRPVLIIEDEAMIAWTLESMLEDMGFDRITVVASGPEALQAARREPPAVIISDVNLGANQMDGVAAATLIVQESSAAVVFITGFASAEARERIGRDLPVASLLRKPVVVAELRRELAVATNSSRRN